MLARDCRTTRLKPLSLVERVCCSCHSTYHNQSGNQTTLYDVLGVPRNATKNDIKKAFFKLSKQLHPDTQHTQHTTSPSRMRKTSFVEINEAYSTLVNPVTRTQYDLQLRTIAEYVPQYHAYRQSYGRRPSTTDSTYHPYSEYDTSEAYTFTRREYGFPEPHEEQFRGGHSKVIISLITLMLLATAVHTYRIHAAHSSYQRLSDLETMKNNLHYEQVRERARNSSVQEQLATLSKRHAETLQKIAVSEKK